MKAISFGVVVAGFIVAAPTSAHHSAAMFDQTKDVTLQGTVKDFEITNPHSWLQVVVPEASGSPVEWSVEMGNPASLLRQGFKRTSIKPGDKVSVTIHPLKDGRPGGLIKTVTTASGAVLPKLAAPTTTY